MHCIGKATETLNSSKKMDSFAYFELFNKFKLGKTM